MPTPTAPLVIMLSVYLDAGSGSLILQAILGGLAGIAVALKALKARLMSKQATEAADSDQDTQVDTSL